MRTSRSRPWSSTAPGTSWQRTPASTSSRATSLPRCSRRPPTCCARACTPTAWRRASRTSAEWRAHLLERLRRQVGVTGDEGLAGLLAELEAYPAPPGAAGHDPSVAIAVPLRFRADGGELAFLSTVATFGTAVDVTLAELSIEAFLPADAATAAALGVG